MSVTFAEVVGFLTNAIIKLSARVSALSTGAEEHEQVKSTGMLQDILTTKIRVQVATILNNSI